jgi:hypothetical protein
MIDPSAFSVVFLVSFSLGFVTFSDCVQELKEYSRRKSLFIRDESGVWGALSQQRVLVEEAQKRLSDRNAEMAELRVAYAVVKEEATQARAAEAVMRTGMDKAREEAAQARRDLEPLSMRVKELEEDVSQVSLQRDTLNVEVTTLKGAVQEKDAALESARQEIEALKAAISDKDSAFLGLERTCGGLRDEVVGLQTHIEGKCDCHGHDVEGPALGINLFVVFQSWRERIERPNLLPTPSRASSKPRSGGPNFSRARSPPCVTVWGSSPTPTPGKMFRGTPSSAGWWRWAALPGRRYGTASITA